MTRHLTQILAIEMIPTRYELHPVKVAFMLQADRWGDYDVAVHLPPVEFQYFDERYDFERKLAKMQAELANDCTAVCSHCGIRKPNDQLLSRLIGKVCQECDKQTGAPRGYYTVGHEGVTGHGVD